jgi:hypothetical protein
VKYIKVLDDSEIIVRNVRNTIHCISPHLKEYQKEVWSFLYSFDAFNITFITHNQNVDADILANATSRFIPPDDGFSVANIVNKEMEGKMTSIK